MIGAALLSALAVQPQLVAPARAAADQDIIVVMVDDLGAIDNRIIDRLPNIHSLFVDNGLEFDKAYSETPLCCPGRASFLTGQHTRHNGVVRNDARLLDPNNTIATALHDAGYFTMMVGKYLNGAAQLTDHTPPGWDEVAMLNDWSTNQASDWWVQDQPVVAGYFDRFIASQSVSWLASAPAGQPLFMWIAPHAPHKSAGTHDDWEPDVEPQYSGDPRCSDIEPWHPPSYDVPELPSGYPLDDICRSMLTVDDMVGQLRAVADSEGRDPLWVLTSDNGMAWGVDGYLLKNVPQADRLPLYVSGPDVVDGRTNALVSNIDFGPTLADAAHTTMPFADGKSFLDVLHGATTSRKQLLEDHPVGGPTGEGDVATGPWWAVRTPSWYLVAWNGVHLYDTNNDPWQMTDVAAAHPDVVAQLKGIYNLPVPGASPSPRPTAPATLPATSPPSATSTPPAVSTPRSRPTAGATPDIAPTPTATPPGSTTGVARRDLGGAWAFVLAVAVLAGCAGLAGAWSGRRLASRRSRNR